MNRSGGAVFPSPSVEPDDVLDLLNRCFAGDEVTENGQTFLFRPRPARPRLLIGGQGEHALQRAARYADGWLPGRIPSSEIAAPIERLRTLCEEAGRPSPVVVMMAGLPLDDPARAAADVEAYASAGVHGLIHAGRFNDERACREGIEALATLKN